MPNREAKVINKVTLIGRLGANPELRHTADGTLMARFRVVTEDSWKSKTGEKTTKTHWHGIVVFRYLAEICASYLTKGRLVYIEGRLQTYSWNDQEGIKRYSTETVASKIKILDRVQPKEESPACSESDEDNSPF